MVKNLILDILRDLCRFFGFDSKNRGKNGAVIPSPETLLPAMPGNQPALPQPEVPPSPNDEKEDRPDTTSKEPPHENSEVSGSSQTEPSVPNNDDNPPLKIPGQRDDSEQTPPTTPPKEPVFEKFQELALEKYEFVCRDIQGQCIIILKILSSEREGFSQNGAPLNFDGRGECTLPDLAAAVICPDGEQMTLFDGENPLIFRFSADWKGTGKLVIRPSQKGDYIAVVPKEWKTANHPPIAPATCADRNFTAHYFAQGEDIIFGGWQSSTARISLRGTIAYDNSEKGDLFVGVAPELQDSQEWKNVSWIRVGKEGGGKWSENFQPNGKTLSAVLDGRTGWFYVRIYDKARKRADSFDFRFSVALRRVLINDAEYSPQTLIVPGNDGHVQTQIRFVGADENNLRPDLQHPNAYVDMREDGVVLVDPHPDVDLTEWKLTESGGSVDIDIALPRVWWRLNGGEWRDKPLAMTRNEFYDRRDEQVEIYTPAHIKAVRAGMNDQLNSKFIGKRFAGKIRRNQMKFELRQFADGVRKSSVLMDLKIQCGDGIFSIILVPDDPPLEPLTPPPEYSILPPTARIKSRKGWRRGKGFSTAELRSAGMTGGKARRKGLRTDMRRKTAHCCNMEALRKFCGHAGE